MKRREIVSKIFGIALVFVMVGAMLVPVHAGGEVTPNMNQASANNTTSITTSKVSTTPILGETKTVTIIPSENVTKPYRKFGNKTVNVVPAENVTKPSRKSVNKTVTVVLSEEITESKEPKGKAVTIIPSEDVSEPEKLESSSYDIEAAVNYAEAWWNGRNTDYYHDYGDYDCANFVSQCLKAGGLDLSAGPGVDAWGCIPSVSNLDYNLRYYQNTQYQVGGSEPLWLVKGDVVLFYSNDGTHRHSAFGVVGDASNYWHGNAHSINCYHKPLSWFLSDPNLDYCVYFHIKDGTVVCPYSCWDRSALSGDALAALVRSHFPLGGVPQTGESMRVTAYAVAKAESGGNPSACGDSDRSIGLWQINMDAHPTYDECLLFEKDYNANAAVQISSSGTNWNPWCTWEKSACGGNGNEAYKQYLTEARKHFYPKVTSLSVSQTSINLGDTVTIYYSVSDDVGLSRVELWRTTDKSGVPDESNWAGIKETSILGTAYSGYFTDTPTASGIYWYGIHVVDNSGAPEAWNCEKNSRTGNWPGVYGPDKVVVTAPQRTITFYTDPTAGGTITFTGSTYSNGQSTTKTDGPYSVSANPASGYVFDHWTTTGGVSVSNANSQSTTATVSGTGSIKAWFTQPQRTITFYTDPTAGGTITFDGSTYSNGQSTTK
ncbi:MAG: amidase domain-containing protein, partial [Dehalococcoidia bacterium]